MRLCYCKWCSRYTAVPQMISDDAIYCRTCATKICWDCSRSMECTLLQELKAYLEPFNDAIQDPTQKYTFDDGFRCLDWSTRMCWFQCSECKLIRHNCNRGVDRYSPAMNPDNVKPQFFSCFVI